MNNVEKVFKKLKEKGLIDKNRNIFENKKTDNFGANHKTKNTEYNSKHTNLEESALIFAILHEEGHFEKISWGRIFFLGTWLILTILSLIVLLLFKLNGLINFFEFIVLVVLTMIIITILFSPISRIDEYKADLNASKKIIEKLKKRPVIGLNNLLKKIDEKNMSSFEKIKRKILRDHPSDEKRIEKIKEFEKQYAKNTNKKVK